MRRGACWTSAVPVPAAAAAVPVAVAAGQGWIAAHDTPWVMSAFRIAVPSWM